MDQLLAWMQKVSMTAWDLGHVFSCDLQTIGFIGNHQGKQWISYKRQGDGFLAGAFSKENAHTHFILGICLHHKICFA